MIVHEPDWKLSRVESLRAAVLDHLRETSGFVSGEALSRYLGATRNTVWKCIEALRAVGYEIDGTTNAGYRLLSSPDIPLTYEVSAGFSAPAIGHAAVYTPTVPSTNDLARQLARNDAPHGLVVVADTQTAGRGRRGRNWVSPPATGVWMSVLLRPNLPPTRLALFPLLAGVAVASAIAKETGLEARLKWPNDVLVHGKKVCGILAEMSAEAEAVHHLVLGIGINVNATLADFPPDLLPTATSLSLSLGQPQRRLPIIRQVLTELEKHYHQLLVDGSKRLLDEVRCISATLNKNVDILGPTGTEFSGVAVGINDDGSLRVRDCVGVEKSFYAGDVSLRPSKD